MNLVLPSIISILNSIQPVSFLITSLGTIFIYVGFEVLTTVVTKCSIFWYITQCSLLKNSPTFRSNISIDSISMDGEYERSQYEAGNMQCKLRSWRWRRHVPPKRQLTSNGLHGIIFYKNSFSIYVISVFCAWYRNVFLTLCNRELFEYRTDNQFLKKFRSFNGTQELIMLLTELTTILCPMSVVSSLCEHILLV
jgi:hypothetical protein